MSETPVKFICSRCKQPVNAYPSIHETDTIMFEVRPCKSCEETTKKFKSALRDFIAT